MDSNVLEIGTEVFVLLDNRIHKGIVIESTVHTKTTMVYTIGTTTSSYVTYKVSLGLLSSKEYHESDVFTSREALIDSL